MRTKKTHPAKPERGVSASKRVEAHLRHAIHAGKLRPRQRIIYEVDTKRRAKHAIGSFNREFNWHYSLTLDLRKLVRRRRNQA